MADDDVVDHILAGRPLMISMPPGMERRVLREARIRRAVEADEDRAEIERRLREACRGKA